MIFSVEMGLLLAAMFILLSESIKEYAQNAGSRTQRVVAKGVSRWIEMVLLGAVIALFFKEYVN